MHTCCNELKDRQVECIDREVARRRLGASRSTLSAQTKRRRGRVPLGGLEASWQGSKKKGVRGDGVYML